MIKAIFGVSWGSERVASIETICESSCVRERTTEERRLRSRRRPILASMVGWSRIVIFDGDIFAAGILTGSMKFGLGESGMCL